MKTPARVTLLGVLAIIGWLVGVGLILSGILWLRSATLAIVGGHLCLLSVMFRFVYSFMRELQRLVDAINTNATILEMVRRSHNKHMADVNNATPVAVRDEETEQHRVALTAVEASAPWQDPEKENPAGGE